MWQASELASSRVGVTDALLGIERHAGMKPVELHKIRRQDPALGRDNEERKHIRLYRNAVEAAAAGKLGDSFERLDKMGAIAARLGERDGNSFYTRFAAVAFWGSF